MKRWQRLVKTLPSTIALTILVISIGLTLGLWQRAFQSLEDLRDRLGRDTWLVQMREDYVGVNRALPTQPSDLAALAAIAEPRNIAYRSSASRPTSGFAIVTAGVSLNYFAVRQLRFSQGRALRQPDEVVLGAELANLLERRQGRAVLGTALELSGGQYRVVGVLASNELRGEADWTSNWEAIVLLEGVRGFVEVTQMFLRATTLNAPKVRGRLENWLNERSIPGYEVRPLAETYSAEVRQRTALLLDQGLAVGVVAIALIALYAAMSVQLSQVFDQLALLGVRRAFGASRTRLFLNALNASWRSLVAPIFIGIAAMWVLSQVFEQTFGLDARPSWQALLISGFLLILVTGFATWWPTRWALHYEPHALISRNVRTPSRDRLALLGLALATAALVMQQVNAIAAIRASEAILGAVGVRVATLSTSLTGIGFVDPRAPVRLTLEDLAALEAGLPNVFKRTAFVQNYFVDLGSGEFVDVRAYSGEFLEIIGARLERGRLPVVTARELVVGRDLAQRLGGGQAVLGRTLTLFAETYQVVGVYSSGSQSIVGGARNDQALFPTGTQAALGIGSAVLVEVNADQPTAQRLEEAAKLLSARHSDPNNQPVRVFRPNDLAPSLLGALRQLSALYALLATVLFVLSASVVLTQQWLWVIGHRAEIAVRRAYGATRQRIRLELLLTASREALFAGVAGLIVGITVSLLFQQAHWLDWFEWGRLGLLPLAAVTLSALATVIPAEFAARLAPAEGVRSE